MFLPIGSVGMFDSLGNPTPSAPMATCRSWIRGYGQTIDHPAGRNPGTVGKTAAMLWRVVILAALRDSSATVDR
jgi:hypothetical protein